MKTIQRILLAATCAATATAFAAPVKLLPPEAGVYHGVFADLPEYLRIGDVSHGTIAFESLVQKGVAFKIGRAHV